MGGGSDSSFVTQSLVQALELKWSKVIGISETHPKFTHSAGTKARPTFKPSSSM